MSTLLLVLAASLITVACVAGATSRRSVFPLTAAGWALGIAGLILRSIEGTLGSLGLAGGLLGMTAVAGLALMPGAITDTRQADEQGRKPMEGEPR